MPPPYVAVQNIKPAASAQAVAPWQLNERLTEVFAHHRAPDHPRQGDVPARPARMPMYAVLAMRQIRSVMAYAQSGVVPKTQFDIAVGSPLGKSLAWKERSNIHRGQSEAFGNRFTVVPEQGMDDARIRLLMGV